MDSLLERWICGVVTAPVLILIGEIGGQVPLVNGPFNARNSNLFEILLCGAVLDREIWVFAVRDTYYLVHQLVGEMSSRMRKVVTKHKDRVVCPVALLAFHCVQVHNFCKINCQVAQVWLI